jgi:hypothetical protein
MLKAVHHHRYLSAEHVRRLFFPTAGIRPVTARLRKLWENKYLDRYFVPLALDGTRGCLRRKHPPYYALATKGARLLCTATGIDMADVPHTPAANRLGFATFEHHLVATDFLTALEAAVAQRNELTAYTWREHQIRPAVCRWSSQTRPRRSFLVSDGAFTVQLDGQRPAAFHLEVVRAGTKAGNATLRTRLARYSHLNKSGFFGKALGQSRLRAVLIMTTSEERAANLRELARTLPYGKHLFWFGAYQSPDRRRDYDTVFTPETIFSPMWRSAGDEELHSILPSPPKPTNHVWASTSTSTITTRTARDGALTSSDPNPSPQRTCPSGTSHSTRLSPSVVVTDVAITPHTVA